MNLRGEIIDHYIKDQRRKALTKFKDSSWLQFQEYLKRDEQLDRLVVSAYVLHNRVKFESLTSYGYRDGLSISYIVQSLHTPDSSEITKLDLLDCGLGIDFKDIDEGCELEFDVPDSLLFEELTKFVTRVFINIGNDTEKIKFHEE